MPAAMGVFAPYTYYTSYVQGYNYLSGEHSYDFHYVGNGTVKHCLILRLLLSFPELALRLTHPVCTVQK